MQPNGRLFTRFNDDIDISEANMARPIKETPILFGEDARRFEARMKEKQHETPEQRERRLYHYKIGMEMMQRGEEINRLRALAREQEILAQKKEIQTLDEITYDNNKS